MKRQNKISWKFAILTLVLTAGIAAIAFGALPSTNPAGASLVRASAETWSGSTQINPAGATAAVAGAFDASVDSTNPSGAIAYIGQFDPISAAVVSPGSQGWLAR